jgi:hypothetical protein
VRDKTGKIFKYMSYGNTHHVEIIKNIKTGKFKGEFVTMMLASHRAKGINMPKQAIVKIDHGDDWEFVMVLYKNDIVSIEQEKGKRNFYKVAKLSGGYDLRLWLHTDATPVKKTDTKTKYQVEKELKIKMIIVEDSINNLVSIKKLKLHNINTIGKIIDND